MSSLHSSQYTDERRPLAVVDTDTTDYYDGIGGLPPPHRLSSTFNAHALSYSPPSSALYLPASPSRSSGRHMYSSHDHEPFETEMQSTQNFAAAGNYAEPPQMRTEHSYASNPFDSRNDLAAAGMRDDQAFLAGDDLAERGGMSPAVAARERYMARKEAQSSPYAYGAGAGGAAGATAASRGCFSGKRKWFWIVGAVALVAAVVGVAVGVSTSKKSGSSESGVTGVVSSDADDPSKFSKNPALHQSFYGMCYTPLNAQYPACGDTLDAVIEDVQLMSQLTSRVRLYGSDCEVSSLVLEAIQKTKVNMTAYLAAWVPQPSDDPDNTVWNRQMNAVLDAIKTYGSDHVDGVTVGNEYLLNGGPVQPLLDKLAQMRTELAALNLPKTIPVGTADAGSMVTTTLAQGSDYVMANVHAWFGGVPIDEAAAWTYSYTANQEPSSATQASNSPTLYIAETGWPTGANATEFETYQAAVAGVPQLNEFLETYVCQANQNITSGDLFSKYFYFEMFDEPWKAIYGGVEEHWGLFNSDKTLKNGVVIPDCAHP